MKIGTIIVVCVIGSFAACLYSILFNARLLIIISLVHRHTPWTVHDGLSPPNPSPKYVSLCIDRLVRGDHRTGNQLFFLAAAIYIAKLTNRQLVMPRTGWKLDKVFDLSSIQRVDNVTKELCPCQRLDLAPYNYDSRFDNETFVNSLTQSNKTILMCGLSQTFRYTIGIERTLRQLLKFRPDTYKEAEQFIHSNPRTPSGKQFHVGVHIRGGDFLDKFRQSYGLTVATESYYRKAVEHICKSRKNVTLFITSDNITNAEEYISKVNAPVSVFYSNSTPDVDLAMLSMSDAVIMSTGTFGWWAAWLANKTTIYYKNYPRYGSGFAKRMNATNYYCPWWLPME